MIFYAEQILGGFPGRPEVLLGNSIRSLSELEALSCPTEKAMCIEWTSACIFDCLHGWRGTVIGADDFLPVLIFVVIRANLWNPFAEVSFIRHFLDRDRSATLDYYLTCFEGISFSCCVP